jgi:hypothetical protein
MFHQDAAATADGWRQYNYAADADLPRMTICPIIKKGKPFLHELYFPRWIITSAGGGVGAAHKLGATSFWFTRK